MNARERAGARVVIRGDRHRYALRPVARAYDRYVPEVFRFVAGNFIANLADVYTAANQLLQALGRADRAGEPEVLLHTEAK